MTARSPICLYNIDLQATEIIPQYNERAILGLYAIRQQYTVSLVSYLIIFDDVIGLQTSSNIGFLLRLKYRHITAYDFTSHWLPRLRQFVCSLRRPIMFYKLEYCQPSARCFTLQLNLLVFHNVRLTFYLILCRLTESVFMHSFCLMPSNVHRHSLVAYPLILQRSI